MVFALLHYGRALKYMHFSSAKLYFSNKFIKFDYCISSKIFNSKHLTIVIRDALLTSNEDGVLNWKVPQNIYKSHLFIEGKNSLSSLH